MSTAQMTKRERVLAALNNKDTDQMVWSPLIDPYFANSLPLQGFNFDVIDSMKYIGNDIILRHVCNPKPIVKNVEKREEKNGNTTRIYYDTPVGSLYQENKDSGETHYISKHMVESIEDMKVFQYICENTTFESRAKEFIEIDKRIGDDGIATMTGPTSPVQDLLQFICGVENTVYLQMDYEDEMQELFQAMHEKNKRSYAALMDYPGAAVFDYEDTSTTVMNINMLENDSAPYYNEYADICHAAGKIFITHMCGKLDGFKEIIATGRQDGIDSVCPPTTGDLYPWDARKAWGEGKVVIGGIEPPSLVWMSVEQTLNTVVDIIEKVESKRGFILSTGDATPFGTPMNNLLAITELINTLGANSLKNEVDRDIVKAIVDKYK